MTLVSYEGSTMSSLIHYQGDQPARIQRTIERRRRETAIVVSQEAVMASLVQTRIDNTFSLTEHTVLRARGLNHLINSMVTEDPVFNRNLRFLEGLPIQTAAMLIQEYGTR